MENVCVCMTVSGHPHYFRAAREAVRSVLARSDFDVFVALGSTGDPLPDTSRVHSHRLGPTTPSIDRAQPFLLKFRALEACLAHSDAAVLLLMDVDALLVADMDAGTVRDALGPAGLGLVEQTAIRGSAMARPDFLQHYVNHTLRWFDPAAAPPTLEAFRFYNGGMVLGTRAEWQRFTLWALERIRGARGAHRVGQHMISDQDYLQYWANSLSRASCIELSWRWNHCEHWDDGFPRRDAYVLHFSNFCNGPGRRQLWRMYLHNRRVFTRWWP
jgi:hypothetical protein